MAHLLERRLDPPQLPMSLETSSRSALPCFEFSTAELPPEEQFDGWRASHSAIFHLDEAGARSAPGFAGHHKVWDLGNLVFSQVSTEGLRFAGLAGHHRREPLDHWLFTLPLSGRSVTFAESTQIHGEAGVVQMVSLGRPFEGHVSNCEVLMLFVPRDLCRDGIQTLDSVSFSRFEGGMGQVLADYMISLASRLPTLDESDLPELLDVTRAMLLACAAPSSRRLEEADNSIAYLQRERARRYIQAHLKDPALDSQKLLQNLGLSRSRLYRLFEASDGVVHYIQRRRLAAAHYALADPMDDRRILEIAECYCFGDAAQFSRAFRREFGYSPTDVRTGAHHRLPRGTPPRHDGQDDPSQRFNQLLRRLQG